MGAIWGDPYTIGGKRGTIPRASRECILPPQRGAMGAHPCLVTLEPRVPSHKPTYGAWPPKGGARWHPPLLGGGRFIASLLVLVSFTSKFTNILGLIGW